MDNLILFHNNLKKCIMAVKQYLHCYNDSSLNAVLCSLQILGQPSKKFTFDSESTLMEEFYINLYKLMNNTNEESDIMWAAINVLQSNVKQGFFSISKLNNYKFTLILTKLLKDQLSLDRKIKILKLLQELTYNRKLKSQESYSSELIILLVKWISSEDKDLISLSLGVLVNICCKNKFAMFILLKCTHSKSFMRVLLKLQSDDIFIKIQVYKLLLILEQVSGQLPSIDINNLVDVIFIILEEGLNQKNAFILQHAVDFFIDISEHSCWKHFVLDYTDYKLKLNNLLDVMNNLKNIEKSDSNYEITFQCSTLVLKFIHHVIQLKNEEFIILYPKILINFLHWTQLFDLHQKSITILQTIIINLHIYNSCIDQCLQCDIYEKLVESLNVLLIYLIKPEGNIENISNMSTWNKYALIFRLLQEILKMQNLYKIIEEKLSFPSLQSIFHSLILIDIKNINNLQNISCVYIEALCLLSDLMIKNPKWVSLYSELLNQKHVYSVLAFIIYNEPKNLGQKVLYLITKFSQQSTIMLSESLEEIKPLTFPKLEIMTNKNSIETEIKPLCSFVQEKQLQMYIDQLENMFNSNEVHNIKTSNVIKLYQYKMNIFKQTEDWLKQSLDNASGEIVQLNYKVFSLNSESMQLNQMLLENHETIDELTMENNKLTMENRELKKHLNDITEKFSAINNDFAELTRNYESKCQIVLERDSTIKNLQKQLEEVHIASKNMKTNLLDQLQNEKTENKAQILKFEQKLKDKQSIINEKIEDIENKTSFIRNQENLLLERDKTIDELHKELQEQDRIREKISKMLATSSKPKFADN